jgi:hypothetical protein
MESETYEDCMQYYITYFGINGDNCLEYYNEPCMDVENYSDNSVYTNTYVLGEVEGTSTYYNAYENCDGTVFDSYELVTETD